MITLADAKRHLRIEFDDEDEAITGYLSAANRAVLDYCRRTTVPAGAEPVFKAAALLFIGDLYENREAQTSIVLTENRAARWLIDPYRLLRV